MPNYRAPVEQTDFDAAAGRAVERGNLSGLAPGIEKYNERCAQRLREYGQCWLDYARRSDDSLPRAWDDFVESDAEVDDWFWATIVELLCSAQEGDRSRAGAQTELDGLMAAYCRAKPNAEISPQRRKKFTILIDTHPQILPPKGFCANWADIERIIKAGVFGDYVHGKWKCARERVQMAALILLLFATSCRPGELVVAGEHDSSQCAKWSDCKFVLHKPALPADPVGLSVEVTIRLLKGRRNDATQTKRIPVVSDHSSAPALDPTLYLFWMAIQDGVFERDFKLEDLATADLSRLPANRTTWELRTNKDALDKPIFRLSSRSRSSPTKPTRLAAGRKRTPTIACLRFAVQLAFPISHSAMCDTFAPTLSTTPS